MMMVKNTGAAVVKKPEEENSGPEIKQHCHEVMCTKQGIKQTSIITIPGRIIDSSDDDGRANPKS